MELKDVERARFINNLCEFSPKPEPQFCGYLEIPPIGRKLETLFSNSLAEIINKMQAKNYLYNVTLYVTYRTTTLRIITKKSCQEIPMVLKMGYRLKIRIEIPITSPIRPITRVIFLFLLKKYSRRITSYL